MTDKIYHALDLLRASNHEIRSYVAEFVGTTLLLAAVVGSGIMAVTLAGGNDAVALLANTVATGTALIALIVAFGPVSGAHFNPAVTLALVLSKALSPRIALGYVVSQLGGAFVGVWLAHIMFGLSVIQQSTHVRTGVGQWTGEFIATFALLSVVLSGNRSKSTHTPFVVAAVITSAYWFTSSTSFANPAVTVARAFTNTFAGIRLADCPAFIASQIAGALAATVFDRWLHQPDTTTSVVHS